jgi:hypothetical protein
MVETSIEELILRLRELQVETARTVELLELARGEETRRRQAETDRALVAVATPVTPVNATSNIASVLVQGNNSDNYQAGDKIVITNATRGNHDKRGTVTRISGNRVYIRTNDNQHTWRYHKNIRLEVRR